MRYRLAAALVFPFIILIHAGFPESLLGQTPHGWDFNFETLCIKAPHPGHTATYWQKVNDCYDSRSWTLANQSENVNFTTCTAHGGRDGQTFLVNSPGPNPLVYWGDLIHYSHEATGGSNYTGHMKVDVYNNAHPCGADHWTWMAFGDWNHLLLPRPDQARLQVTLHYDRLIPNGAARACIGIQGFWQDVSYARAHMVEICETSNWGDSEPHPGVVTFRDLPDLQFVQVDAGYYGVGFPAGSDRTVIVNFSTILNDLVASGYLSPPVGGWSATATQAIFLSIEGHNFSATAGDVMVDLWFTDFRITN